MPDVKLQPNQCDGLSRQDIYLFADIKHTEKPGNDMLVHFVDLTGMACCNKMN